MTDAIDRSSTRATTAGGLLRQARQAQGMHIAALAAAIKVHPSKLERLEADQFDQLPDITFARALAQSVCRTLKIDAAPVLALLPAAAHDRLEQLSEGLNTPFAERPGRLIPSPLESLANPVFWLAGALVVGAVLVYAMPVSWIPGLHSLPKKVGVAPAASAVMAAAPEPVPAASTAVVAEPAASTVLAPVGASEPVPAAANESARLQVSTTAPSWVEITDARGQPVLSRLVQAGEVVPLDAPLPLPLKLKIGNASATHIVFRGQAVELTPYTRDNVARFDLQ